MATQRQTVVHINLFDYEGGAARIAWTLMEGLNALGHDHYIFAHRQSIRHPKVLGLPLPDTGWQQDLLLRQQNQKLQDVYSAALLKVINHPLFERADVVHLHCVNGNYCSLLLLPFLAARPLVWTMHDTLSFTGGCLNTEQCSRWINQECSACPLPGTQLDRHGLFSLKRQMYGLSGFTVVCPSQWMQRQIGSSMLAQHDCRLIRNGVDVETFRPADQVLLKGELGVAPETPVIMFAAHGGLDSGGKGGNLLMPALNQLCARHPDAVLLHVGTNPERGRTLPMKNIALPFTRDRRQMARYYAAADVFVSPSQAENLSLAICEAQSCGTPVVAFAIGGTPEIIEDHQTGYLAKPFDIHDLVRGLEYCLFDQEFRGFSGQRARLRVVESFNDRQMIRQYEELYDQLVQRSRTTVRTAKHSRSGAVLPVGSMNLPLTQEKVNSMVDAARVRGWDAVWQQFDALLKQPQWQQGSNRAVFIDWYLTHCLTAIDPRTVFMQLMTVMERWLQQRHLPSRSGNMPPVERPAAVQFGSELRRSLTALISQVPLSAWPHLNDCQQHTFIQLWRRIFFNSFAPLNLYSEARVPAALTKATTGGGDYDFLRMLLLSMYQPFSTAPYRFQVATLAAARIPGWCKLVLMIWAINVPYYNLDNQHRLQMVEYGRDICTYLSGQAIKLPAAQFALLVEELMAAFWRSSYAGGNHVEALSAFGDFIAHHMCMLYPSIRQHPVPTRREDGTWRTGHIHTMLQQRFPDQQPSNHHVNKKELLEIWKARASVAATGHRRWRIGYISRNFASQAVSYYMVNRVIHHDTEQFELFIFAMGKRNDEITKLFTNHCDHFRQFKNINDIPAMAQEVLDAQLDLLIYGDIGMDPVTYMMAGLQLAPLQAVLVGHGITSGMPTIQYYISGDHEPQDAQRHYREAVIKLPDAGAAQYPPGQAGKQFTRSELHIPDDAIVFISCANGLKHGPARDDLFIKILRQAPNAWIVLKPFQNPMSVNPKFIRRIKAKARQAGVAERLLLLPPLEHPRDVMGLLAIADVQLDSYPYGGWTTNMEALHMGLPLVTQRGELARSRWGARLLDVLGVHEGIARNDQEYVRWAVAFAQNRDLLVRTKSRIEQYTAERLFNGARAQLAYEQALTAICENLPRDNIRR